MATDADFTTAVRQVLMFEGGYNASDPSNMGITQNAYDQWRAARGQSSRSVRDLTEPEAIDIYYSGYWLASGADRLSMPLALIHFDTAVNMGPGTARTLLAQAGNDTGRYLALRADLYQAIAVAQPHKAQWLPVWLKRVSTLARLTGGTPTVVVATAAAIAVGLWTLTKVR